MESIEPTIHINYRTKKQGMWMHTYSKKLFYLLKEEFQFPEGKKGNKLTIPSTIRESDELLQKYMRGVFDTDGCLYFDCRAKYIKPYPRIRLEITSQKLFKEIANYLGQHFRICTCLAKRQGFQRTDILEIYGRKQLDKWLMLIWLFK